MRKIQLSKIGLLSVIVAPVLFASAATYASGSFSGGGGGSVNAAEQKQYHAGKSVLRKKLKCSGCLLDGKKINKSTAADVLTQLKSGEFSAVLVDKEEAALATYLMRRYKIESK